MLIDPYSRTLAGLNGIVGGAALVCSDVARSSQATGVAVSSVIAASRAIVKRGG
jgi:hypothetical protein